MRILVLVLTVVITGSVQGTDCFTEQYYYCDGEVTLYDRMVAKNRAIADHRRTEQTHRELVVEMRRQNAILERVLNEYKNPRN